MATVILTGQCCECCALVIANDDDSGCRDYSGHAHPAPRVSERMARQADEIYGATQEPDSWMRSHPHEGQPIGWIAWVVISGDEDETFCGACDLCGEGDGYFQGWEFSIVR